MDIVLSTKIIIFSYIVISPFISYKYLSFLNTIAAKISIILLIIGTTFLDIQLAIILTLAFLILVINLNKSTIEPYIQKLQSSSERMVPIKTASSPVISEFPDKCDDIVIEKEQINKDMYDIYIDPKIKAYDAYIRMLSSPNMIEDASGI